ncbi:hypothetical protein N9007_00325 [bacterium]|nr:hypothetical protein [bacterium]MDB4399525.1 hypothetical protein [bacterium]MDC3223502.1 hypothetical protein [Mariniblastus sp.]
MSRFILSILFSMLAAGLCDLSYGQDANQPTKERPAKENQITADIPQPTTISNAFTRSLPQDSTHASDIQTRVEASKPTARGHARAYYEPDATYSNPGLKPLLSPFPRTRSSLTPNAFATGKKTQGNAAIEFEFGTIMTFPAVAEDEPRLSNQPNFSLASTPLKQPKEVAETKIIKTKIIEISTGTPSVILLNQPNLFEIKVRNRSPQNATNIIVQMQISKNLMLTGFDRRSWVDESRRTVSWKIDNLDGETDTVIRFRAQSNAIGRDTQKITAGMENQFQGTCELVTEVVTPIDDNDPENAIRNN